MRKAFTLIELMLVIVIIGIMAAFFMPGFGKTLTRAKASDAMANLSLICGANAIYKSKHGFNIAPTGTVTGVGAINSLLGLDLMPNGLTYSCASGSCTAVATNISTSVNLNQGLTTTNPACLSGSTYCP